MKIKSLIPLCVIVLLSSSLLAQRNTDPVHLKSEDLPAKRQYRTEGDDFVQTRLCGGADSPDLEVISRKAGWEFYCSGNVHAEGPLKPSKSGRMILADEEPQRTVAYEEFVRDGAWKVYYDSTLQILRSEGHFDEGTLDGIWTFYGRNGKPYLEIEYAWGSCKSATEISSNGQRKTVFSKSLIELLVSKYLAFVIVLGVFPIVVIRIGWNIKTYNRIHGTNFIPLLQNWQKGGRAVSNYCTFVFWWAIRSQDSDEVRSHKQTANWISLMSVFWFGIAAALLVMYAPR